MTEEQLRYIARAVVLLTAMPIHECAHGLVAYYLGDPTPKVQRRLSLNPLRHLDPLGSLLILFSGFGWAKPVQVDPRNFARPRRDMGLTALAGPMANILVALLLTALYKVLLGVVDLPLLRTSDLAYIAIVILNYMVWINLYLAVFNLLPLPPLDGSKIIGAVLPERLYFGIMRYERYIAGVLFFLIVFTEILTRPLQWMAGGLMWLLDFITLPLDLFFRLG